MVEKINQIEWETLFFFFRDDYNVQSDSGNAIIGLCVRIRFSAVQWTFDKPGRERNNIIRNSMRCYSELSWTHYASECVLCVRT